MKHTAEEFEKAAPSESISASALNSIDQCVMRILIIDDDPADSKLCELNIKKVDAGRSVQCVSTGAAALQCLAEETFDCILLDYHLADGSADTYIQQIVATHPWTPIIMLSGAGDERKAARAMRLGAADYLTKDRITAQALNRSIINAITKWGLSRSLHIERRELLAANRELHKQRREIQSFYHTVSHELKTPITAIREFSSLVADEVLGEINPEQKDAMQTSMTCCDRLTRLVHDLFDAARIETGKLELHVETIDLNDLIAREIRIMQSKAAERNITLVSAQDVSLPAVELDPSRISQVLCNLVSNAIKYTDHGGKVSVSVGQDAGHCVVKIIDNGFGIASEHAEFIFDRLYQCDRQDGIETSSDNGMGIGLYLSKKIIELHDGDINVVSRLGSGSTFTFRLPFKDAT